MNSLRRMLDVLELLTRDRPTIDVDTVCKELGYAQASAYRYISELTQVGLLVRLPGGYALGPRVIELDLQMRESDPLLRQSHDRMVELRTQTGLNVLLSELYGEKVISIHQEFGLDPSPLNFGRGRPMALFRSATAQIILAHLPARQLKRLHEQHGRSDDVQALGHDWKAFSRRLLQLRKQGYCLSKGELDSDKTGLAAPIFGDRQRVIGSITLVGSSARIEAFNERFLSESICSAAADISKAMAMAMAIVTPTPAPASISSPVLE